MLSHLKLQMIFFFLGSKKSLINFLFNRENYKCLYFSVLTYFSQLYDISYNNTLLFSQDQLIFLLYRPLVRLNPMIQKNFENILINWYFLEFLKIYNLMYLYHKCNREWVQKSCIKNWKFFNTSLYSLLIYIT